MSNYTERGDEEKEVNINNRRGSQRDMVKTGEGKRV